MDIWKPILEFIYWNKSLVIAHKNIQTNKQKNPVSEMKELTTHIISIFQHQIAAVPKIT